MTHWRHIQLLPGPQSRRQCCSTPGIFKTWGKTNLKKQVAESVSHLPAHEDRSLRIADSRSGSCICRGSFSSWVSWGALKTKAILKYCIHPLSQNYYYNRNPTSIFSIIWCDFRPSIYHCCCSVTEFHLTLCDHMNCNTPGFSVLHPEFGQTCVHWVGDAIQLSHSLLPTSLSALNLSQHQGPLQWVGSSHQVAEI